MAAVCSHSTTEPFQPCQVASIIDYQCATGFGIHDITPGCDESKAETEGCPQAESQQSPEFQRNCYCESLYLDSVRGCHACFLAHGGGDTPSWYQFNFTMLPSIMKDYCNPSADPTAGFIEYLAPAWPTFTFSQAADVSTGPHCRHLL